MQNYYSSLRQFVSKNFDFETKAYYNYYYCFNYNINNYY